MKTSMSYRDIQNILFRGMIIDCNLLVVADTVRDISGSPSLSVDDNSMNLQSPIISKQSFNVLDKPRRDPTNSLRFVRDLRVKICFTS